MPVGVASVRRVALPLLLLFAGACSKEIPPYKPKPGTSYDPATRLPSEIISTKDSAEMVLVPAGVLRAGDPMGITEAVRIKPFYIDRYEVTNRRYYGFTFATGHEAPTPASADADGLAWTDGGYPAGRGNRPMVLVTPDDALAFARWAGKRLPTQRQWERAARGPKNSIYPWGGEPLAFGECNTADRLAGRELGGRAAWDEWYSSWSKRAPRERNAEAFGRVGAHARDVSAFGVRDLGGSVREWCIRKAQNHVNGPDPDGLDPVSADAVVVCGGSWLKDIGRSQSWRYASIPAARHIDVGFRCVVPADLPAIQALARPAGQ